MDLASSNSSPSRNNQRLSQARTTLGHPTTRPNHPLAHNQLDPTTPSPPRRNSHFSPTSASLLYRHCKSNRLPTNSTRDRIPSKISQRLSSKLLSSRSKHNSRGHRKTLTLRSLTISWRLAKVKTLSETLATSASQHSTQHLALSSTRWAQAGQDRTPFSRKHRPLSNSPHRRGPQLDLVGTTHSVQGHRSSRVNLRVAA